MQFIALTEFINSRRASVYSRIRTGHPGSRPESDPGYCYVLAACGGRRVRLMVRPTGSDPGPWSVDTSGHRILQREIVNKLVVAGVEVKWRIVFE